MSRILEFADAMPETRHGRPPGQVWREIATELRAAGRRAGRIDRKTKGMSKIERERAGAEGLRIGLRVVNGERQWWVELLDTPTAAGPPPCRTRTVTRQRLERHGAHRG